LRLVTALYWAGIFVLTHLPPAQVPKTRVSDKLLHFWVYAVLTALLHVSLWPTRRSAWVLGVGAVIVALTYGAVDEMTQPLIGRTCSLQDWYANAAGAVVAGTLVTIARIASDR
jgi:VanZ family protein